MASNNNKEIIRLEKKYKNLLNDPNNTVSAGAATLLSLLEREKKLIPYRRIGGRVRAEIRKKDALVDKDVIHAEASKLLKDGKEKKDIAGRGFLIPALITTSMKLSGFHYVNSSDYSFGFDSSAMTIIFS